jgi:hypothetical protein
MKYCRGADDQSRGRGVLDTRFRGYDVRPSAGGSRDEVPCRRQILMNFYAQSFAAMFTQKSRVRGI